MIRMVVFDMAGTTIDENNIVYKTLQRAINDQGFNFTLDEVLAEGAGKEKLQAIKSVLALKGIKDDELAEKTFKQFLILLDKAYSSEDVFEQDGASKLFEKLRSNKIFVVLNTGYNTETAEMLLKKIGWKKGTDYDLLVTASDVPKSRPNPDMILLAMKELGITDSAEVIKVGDSIIDIEEGKNAGCRFSIGITTGAHTYDQLQSANPEFIIDNLLELEAMVFQTEAIKQ